jgi:hypothetical protein
MEFSSVSELLWQMTPVSIVASLVSEAMEKRA